MKKEAIEIFKNLKEFLEKKYGEESLQHLTTIRREIQDETFENDDDAENYLLEMDEDNNEGILMEGYKIIIGEDSSPKPQDDSTINILTSQDTLESDSSLKLRLTMSSYGDMSRASVALNNLVNWHPSIEDKKDHEIRKVKNTMGDLKISDDELNKWKEDNKTAVETLEMVNNGDWYKVMKGIIKIMKTKKGIEVSETRNKIDNTIAGDCENSPVSYT